MRLHAESYQLFPTMEHIPAPAPVSLLPPTYIDRRFVSIPIVPGIVPLSSSFVINCRTSSTVSAPIAAGMVPLSLAWLMRRWVRAVSVPIVSGIVPPLILSSRSRIMHAEGAAMQSFHFWCSSRIGCVGDDVGAFVGIVVGFELGVALGTIVGAIVGM